MWMLAEARLQRVPVIMALAPAHRKVTALDNVLVKMPESAGGVASSRSRLNVIFILQ